MCVARLITLDHASEKISALLPNFAKAQAFGVHLETTIPVGQYLNFELKHLGHGYRLCVCLFI